MLGPPGELAPPPRGNPGSATAYGLHCLTDCCRFGENIVKVTYQLTGLMSVGVTTHKASNVEIYECLFVCVSNFDLIGY